MTDIYDGDPLVTLDGDGADLVFPGNGQPIMDTGVENQVNFSLLTKSNHWSEDLEKNAARRYSGLFLQSLEQPITRDSLISNARAAEVDTAADLFGSVSVEMTNPVGQQRLLKIEFEPISNDPFVLRLTQNGENWIQQIERPANEKL